MIVRSPCLKFRQGLGISGTLPSHISNLTKLTYLCALLTRTAARVPPWLERDARPAL